MNKQGRGLVWCEQAREWERLVGASSGELDVNKQGQGGCYCEQTREKREVKLSTRKGGEEGGWRRIPAPRNPHTLLRRTLPS